jgi:hypothetical protein
MGLLGNIMYVVTFIYDNYASFNVETYPSSDILIYYVVVRHEYNVGSLYLQPLLVVGAHTFLFKELAQLLYRQRILD